MNNKESPPDYQSTASAATASFAQSPPAVTMMQPTPLYGRNPMQLKCPNCGRTVITAVRRENGLGAYIAVVVILVLFFPFAWIPLCIDSCKDVHHSCPVCKALLGSMKKI